MHPASVQLEPSRRPHLFNGPAVGEETAAERLRRIDDLVKAMSGQDDPDTLVRLFARQADLLVRRDAFVTVTRRDLTPPRYRITRSSRWDEVINPWTEAHRLPVHDRGLLGELLYAGRPAIINRLRLAPDDPSREYLEGMQSLACAPSYDRGQATNLVVLLRREPDSFTQEDLESLLLHGNLLGRAVANLLLARQLEEAYCRLDEEMQQAGRMQRALLPEDLPIIDGLELAASYVTCSRAGGDYYHAVPIADGRWGVFLADVSGHGVAAAVGMGMLHTLLHSCPPPLEPPARVLEHLNRHLYRVAPRGLFATAFYGVYDPRQRLLRYALAGHPPPLRRRGHRVHELEMTGGLPLGVVPEFNGGEKEVPLSPGDALLLYTDGIVEGANGEGEAFGKDRLTDALRLGPPRAVRLVSHVERLYRDFCGEAPDMDDRTLLAVVAVP